MTSVYLRPAEELVENSAASGMGLHLKYFTLRDRYYSLIIDWLTLPVNSGMASWIQIERRLLEGRFALAPAFEQS